MHLKIIIHFTLIILGVENSVIGPFQLANIATQLSEKYSDKMDALYDAFNTRKVPRYGKPETKVLQIIIEFFDRSTNEEFKAKITGLGDKLL